MDKVRLFYRMAGFGDRILIKQIVHWLVFFAVILHLFSCIFLGQSHMPEVF